VVAGLQQPQFDPRVPDAPGEIQAVVGRDRVVECMTCFAVASPVWFGRDRISSGS
jgi:hypothetical protein